MSKARHIKIKSRHELKGPERDNHGSMGKYQKSHRAGTCTGNPRAQHAHVPILGFKNKNCAQQTTCESPCTPLLGTPVRRVWFNPDPLRAPPAQGSTRALGKAVVDRCYRVSTAWVGDLHPPTHPHHTKLPTHGAGVVQADTHRGNKKLLTPPTTTNTTHSTTHVSSNT